MIPNISIISSTSLLTTFIIFVSLLSGCHITGDDNSPTAVAEQQATTFAPTQAPLFATWDAKSTETSNMWETLRKHPTTVDNAQFDGICPMADLQNLVPFLPPVLGEKPVYTEGELTTSQVDPSFSRRTLTEDGWARYKMLWATSPNYDGPALVRGWQLNGDHAVRFFGEPNEQELQLDPTKAGKAVEYPDWRLWTSYVGVQSPGCYVFQVDGQSFSKHIIVEVPS